MGVMQKLKTIDDVVLILGGTAAAGRALAVGMTAISNWKAHRQIPANQYLAVNALLETRDCMADTDLFAFRKVRRKQPDKGGVKHV